MIDKSSIVKTLQLEDMTHEDQMQVLASIEQSIKESKAKQKEQLKSNVDFVVEALRGIKSDLETRFNKLDSTLVTKVDRILKGRDGLNGKDGAPGKDGRPGRDGAPGVNGKDGQNGKDGVGVSKAKVDIDGELVITLTDGTVIEAGKVFTKAVAEKIRVFSNADNRVPELVGQADKILSNDGTNLKWIVNSGGGGGSGTVTSVGLSAPTGLTVSGSPVTTSGTLALTFTAGYSIPTTSSQTNWDTAYGWGNHASAGYAVAANNLSDLTSASSARTNLGLGTAATMTGPSGTIVGTSDTQTLTNKRINPRVVAASATSGSLTPNGDTTDVYNAMGLTGAITLNAPSGTPVDGQKLIIRLEDNGTGRGITWTTSSGAFRAVGVTLPTTTTASKVTYIGCVYNSTDVFWDIIAVATQA